jgi:peroxiredoxin
MALKRIILVSFGAILLVLGGVVAWKLGPALLPAKHVEVGIAVGARAPVDLPLRDMHGQATTLNAQMGERGLVLFLVRSADWCPFCKAQLIRSEKIREAVSARGYSMASLSYDEPSVLNEFARSKGVGYAMLSDKGSKLISAMGLRDPQYAADSKAFGVPRASVLVIGTDGTVRAKFVDEDYRSRQSNEQVLSMVAAVDKQAN